VLGNYRSILTDMNMSEAEIVARIREVLQ
jgi:hypothetical protein